MQTKNRSRTKLTTIAAFPRHYFLENVAVRGDNSMLVTVMNTIHERPVTCWDSVHYAAWENQKRPSARRVSPALHRPQQQP